MGKAKVYFTKKITKENIVKMYEALGVELPGKVAVKVHSGEAGNQNFLRPPFYKPIVDRVKGTIVESNTAYDGERNSTEKHKKLLVNHGWSAYYDVNLLDAEGPDVEFDVVNGKRLQKNRVGKDILNYDSMLVVSHFKGHPLGGYGGALKQLSIGCASQAGKCRIHSAGEFDDQRCWENMAEGEVFTESMADAASSVVKHFDGNMAFVSVMCNMSVDCDCCAIAEDPCMKDIGILSSLDPLALDRACMDLVLKSEDPGRDHFLERVNTRCGMHVMDAAAELGIGSLEYELVCLD